MPIINKGIFDTDVVFQRQVGNDWPTAQVITTSDVIETTNLYFTDERAVTAVTPLLTTANVVEEGNLYYTDERASSNTINLMQSFQGDNITIEANGRISASIASGGGGTDLTGNTTSDLAEGENLYFTLARAREAYTAGLGIKITGEGVISAKGDDTGLGLFNSGMNLSANLKPTASYANIKTFPAIEGNTFIVFSFLATNRSSNTSYVSARVNVDGNIVMLANLLKLPPNSSTEIFRKPQIFKIDDTIEILSLNQNKDPAANLINTYISYQASHDNTFDRNVVSISDNQAYMLYQTPGRSSIVESINLVNLGPNVMPVDAYITNNDDELVTYLVSNLIIPAHTSVEICEYPKAILDNDKIWVQKWDNPREMAVFVSSKITSSYEVGPSTNVIVEGGTITFNIVTTSVLDGTLLFYELQQV